MMDNQTKRYLEVDPDYEKIDTKRPKPKPDVTEKVREIINREFDKDLDFRQSQLETIQQRITKVKKMLHILRYALVTAYYENKNTLITQPPKEDNENTIQDVAAKFDPQNRIHPAVKKLLSNNSAFDCNYLHSKRNRKSQSVSQPVKQETDSQVSDLKIEVGMEDSGAKGDSDYVDVRNRKKIKKRIIVGNISKWMPSSESKEDSSTHKWMVYVRGSKESPDIDYFVEKVVFYLHPSYKPNDVIEIKKAPFHLSRRGWGEFPLRVQIFFKCGLNKPVDVIHNLKLDRTFTGRQTLGNETICDLHLYDDTTKPEAPSDDIQQTELIFPSIFEHDYCFELSNTAIKMEPNEYITMDHNYSLSSDLEQNSSTALDPINVNLLYGLGNAQTNDFFEEYNEDDAHRIVLDNKKFKSVNEALPYVLRRLPLITEKAADVNYKKCFPYAAASTEQYLSWNVGRKLSSEWRRASMALDIIKSARISGCDEWNTKSVLLYARSHAYTIDCNYGSFKRNKKIAELILNYPITKEKPVSYIKEEEIPVNITDTIIEATNTQDDDTVKEILDQNLEAEFAFIRNEALESRVSLQPEKLDSGLYFNGAERMIYEAVKLFAEDLIRNSHAHLLFSEEPNGDFKEITVQAVAQALNSRTEYQKVLNYVNKVNEMQYYW